MTMRSLILAALALLGAASAPAFAQTANKTWVSSASGNDSGTCQFVSPCKTFAYAITQTAAGGELDVKDSGSYGVVTINKAISIVGTGALAAIAVPSGTIGISVNVSGASDKVVLRGLVIDGHGVGADGIDLGGGGELTVDQCQIRNVTGFAIGMESGAGALQVADTTVSNSGDGIYVSVNGMVAALNNVKIYGNNKGIDATNDSFVTVVNSVLSDNVYGIYTEASGNAAVYVGQSTITGNGQYGIDVEGGTVKSFGDNDFIANVIDLKGTLGSATKR